MLVCLTKSLAHDADFAVASFISDFLRELKRTRDELQETDEKYPAIQAIIDAHWDK